MNRPDITDIPEDLRRKVVAYFWRGFSTKETSQRFSMPRDTVEEIIRWRVRPGGEQVKTPKLTSQWPGHRQEA